MNSTPLTREKLRFFQLDQAHPGNALVNLPLALALTGALDVDALGWAVQELGRRNPILRSAIMMSEGRAYQVTKDIELALEVEDYRALDEEQRDRTIGKRRALEIRRPFDHSRAPLIRFFLFKEAPERAVLLLVTTRVILDEISFEPLLSELCELYETRSTGREPPPESGLRLAKLTSPEPPLPSISEEQRVAFWRERLSGMPRTLDLAPDRPRPQQVNGTANHVSMMLDPAETRTLKKLAESQGVALESIALAALELVLARQSGQADFGVTVHGNGRAELVGRNVGMLENPVIIRSDVPAGGTFSDLCWRVESSRNEAFAHQDLPFDRLAHSVLGERDLDELPLHQLAFRCKNGSGRVLRLGAAEVEPLSSAIRVSTVELGFWIEQRGSALHIGVDAMAQLYDAETAARLCRALRYVLASAARVWTTELEDVELLSSEDQRAWVEALNQTEAPWESQALVHRLFEQQVDRRPDVTALLFEDRALTFRQLDERANAIAHALRHRGVGPDVLVGLCLERGPDLVASMLAIHKAGGAYVPLDPDYPSERLAHVLTDSRAKVLVTTDKLAERLSAAPELLLLDLHADELKRSPKTRLAEPEHPSQLAYVIYTSGSTGKPKGVMVEHQNVTSFFKGMELGIELHQEGVWLAGTSISFDISVLEILGSLCYGRRVALLGESVLGQVENPRYTIPALVERHGVTHFQCTPSQARVLLLDEAGRRALASLEMLMVGGEALSADLANELLSLVSGQVVNLYGPTETTVWSCVSRVRPGEIVTIGKPIANTAVFILDERGALAPPGAPGELYIAGPGVTRGYFGRPELTAERFVENRVSPERGARLYRTGDLVRLSPNGRLVYLGRNDHQVKVRGHRIELGEIESALRRTPGITDAVVAARGAETDKRLVAYVVTGSGYPGAEGVRARLRSALPAFMLPASIVCLPALPLTPNGKVDRNALPEPAETLERLELVAPRNATEATLCEIWQQALELPKIGVNEDFFDLGGHSLVAVKISNEVWRVFGARLPLAALFESPTVESLAARLGPVGAKRQTAIAKAFTSIVPIQPHGSRPPLFCVAGLGGNPMNLRHVAAELGEDQPFFGLQMRGVDGQHPPHRNIREMAADFLGDIRSLQPRGPYFLAGYSAGGLAAYEIAQQLLAAGEQVGLVVLFDTLSPAAPSWSLSERLDAHLRNLRQRGATTYLANRAMARVRAEAERMTRRLRARLATLFPFQFRNDAVWVATEEAAATYRAEPYAGDVLLLQADSALTAGEGIGDRPHQTNGWGALVQGNFEVVRLGSSHVDIVSEETSPLVAEALRSALRRALARLTGPERLIELPSSRNASPEPPSRGRRESRREVA
jgi:amino acid adenylation domain-containing protein